MALLLDAETEVTTGSSNEFTTPVSVYVRGLEGGKLAIEVSPDVDPPVWAPVITGRSFDAGFVVSPVGTYLLRASLLEVKSDTECTVHAIPE